MTVQIETASSLAQGTKKLASVLRAMVLLLLVAGTAAALVLLPVRELLARFLDWVGAAGPWGPAILGAAYIPATVLFVPGSLLTLGAGFLFGVVRGTIAVSLGSTTGSAAAFLLGRTLARSWIEARVSRNPKFRAIDRAVAEQGFKIVLLTRLSPIFPYNMLGYALKWTSHVAPLVTPFTSSRYRAQLQAALRTSEAGGILQSVLKIVHGDRSP